MILGAGKSNNKVPTDLVSVMQAIITWQRAERAGLTGLLSRLLHLHKLLASQDLPPPATVPQGLML